MTLSKAATKFFVAKGKDGAEKRWRFVVERKTQIMAELYKGRDRDLINWLTAGKSLEWLERFLKYANRK